ncbi:cytochrome P450 9e2-like [Melitaea cinxia]|uniref:cytochrome P450 9e2-like n=1 Tax=Melitaea cinxia TaxID=113334 RepID=UPI001E26FBEC|nr:cytochrome P450 9e2-like [Melitaea cinxia]
MIVEVLILLLTFLLVYLFSLHRRIQQYFDEQGVKYLPGIPIFGNAFKSIFLLDHFVRDIDVVYKAFPNDRYVGYIEGITPIILVRDPELIKTITVKDFEHFVDRKPLLDEETEPLVGSNLFLMKGEKWHDMRTTLSPAFTSSKIKKMMPFMTKISANIIEYLRDHTNEEIDVEDVMRRYTNDVIAASAFGLEVNSLKDKNNEFYRTGQKMLALNSFQRFKFVVSTMFPNVCKKLGVRIFPEEKTRFFKNLVTSTMDYREKNKVEKPDMIQLLMEAYKGTLKDEEDEISSQAVGGFKPKSKQRQWTKDELAGQVFVFFLAGFDASATLLAFCVHELALNPDVQEKLYQEIKEFKEENGVLTYENMSKLKYLECVLSETSRKWTPINLDRVCTKYYKLPPPREGAKPVKVRPGDVIYNVVNSIQMDPAHHPHPEKFDPSRFSDENKHKIKPFTFMPFGKGPRICIGARFALLEVKTLLYNFVLNFKINKCEKTVDPIKLVPHEFNICIKGGSWVKLERRT